MTMLMVDSDQLGSVDVEETSVIEFPAGLIGFPDHRRYAMVSADDGGLYTWLQSVDEPSLAFLAVVPAPFFPDFAPTIRDEECAAIELVDPDHAQLLCLVTVSDDAVTANLLGPIVLNVRTRLARQVVLNDTDLTTKALIVTT
ncbi:MAG: flagellar assembly protein FliW [Microthrixaceae bacterium]